MEGQIHLSDVILARIELLSFFNCLPSILCQFINLGALRLDVKNLFVLRFHLNNEEVFISTLENTV